MILLVRLEIKIYITNIQLSLNCYQWYKNWFEIFFDHKVIDVICLISHVMISLSINYCSKSID